jgi:hypothetical protein
MQNEFLGKTEVGFVKNDNGSVIRLQFARSGTVGVSYSVLFEEM